MLEKGIALVLITAFALACTGSSQDDDIGEGLFIDGPGGYLPDIGDDVDIGMDFPQAPSIDEGFTDHMIMYRGLLDILNYWENYLRLFLL